MMRISAVEASCYVKLQLTTIVLVEVTLNMLKDRVIHFNITGV